MFSVGASPYNSLLSSLYGGSAKRRAWLNSVKSGKVKRDSKGRFLPRGGKKSSRRYKSSAYYDLVEPDTSFTSVGSSLRGISQSGVDQTAMNLTKLKRKWDYYKDFMDDGNDNAPPPEMYPLAGKILRNLRYLERAQKLDYYPTYPVPYFGGDDQELINHMFEIGLATRRMGGREYDRQVALELAGNGSRREKRRRIRQAMKLAKKKLGGEDLEEYANVWTRDYNDPDDDFFGRRGGPAPPAGPPNPLMAKPEADLNLV